MQRLEVSGAVQPIYASLGVKRLNINSIKITIFFSKMLIYTKLILSIVLFIH